MRSLRLHQLGKLSFDAPYLELSLNITFSKSNCKAFFTHGFRENLLKMSVFFLLPKISGETPVLTYTETIHYNIITSSK